MSFILQRGSVDFHLFGCPKEHGLVDLILGKLGAVELLLPAGSPAKLSVGFGTFGALVLCLAQQLHFDFKILTLGRLFFSRSCSNALSLP